MTAQDHIIAWIESSRPHYDRLLEIEAMCKHASHSAANVIRQAGSLVGDAYWEMVICGDARRDDPYSAVDLALAVGLVVAWELEQ